MKDRIGDPKYNLSETDLLAENQIDKLWDQLSGVGKRRWPYNITTLEERNRFVCLVNKWFGQSVGQGRIVIRLRTMDLPISHQMVKEIYDDWGYDYTPKNNPQLAGPKSRK